MKYISTRNPSVSFSASEAIVKGLSDEGGLFVADQPEKVHFTLDDFLNKDYKSLAKTILSAFFDDFSDTQLQECIDLAYNDKNFSTSKIFPIKTYGNYSYLELFTGRTSAFKDCALSILPHLLRHALKNTQQDKKVLILTATSGDTGKAALAGFAGVEGVDICVFYPKTGVSYLQQLQMQTQQEKNTQCFAFEGNFDDCQNTVKDIFNDETFKHTLQEKGVVLSSANSINIGRLFPQMVYYFYAYALLVNNKTIQPGEKINFCVPTGNFGNILAGYYAKQMGLPVNKLILASNENHVLYDFFQTGTYDKNRPFIRTIAPSMDILISSNLERLLFEMTQRNTQTLTALMQSLHTQGSYHIDIAHNIRNTFTQAYATQDDLRKTIKEEFEKNHYLIDTHTAAAKYAFDHCSPFDNHTVILATASPFKFASDVFTALYRFCPRASEEFILQELSRRTQTPVPAPLLELFSAHRRPVVTTDTARARDNILAFLDKGGLL